MLDRVANFPMCPRQFEYELPAKPPTALDSTAHHVYAAALDRAWMESEEFGHALLAWCVDIHGGGEVFYISPHFRNARAAYRRRVNAPQ